MRAAPTFPTFPVLTAFLLFAKERKTERNSVAEQTNAKKLEARIVQLENALKALSALRKPVDLTADEIKTYLKVRDAIAGDVLGIANCARGAEACVANCASRGTEACVANCGSRAAPCVANCASRAEACSSPSSRGGCDIGYLGGGGLARFSDLGS